MEWNKPINKMSKKELERFNSKCRVLLFESYKKMIEEDETKECYDELYEFTVARLQADKLGRHA